MKTILFVDGEVNVLYSLKRIFGKEGYEVFTCSSGEEALKVLAEKRCDVLVADQQMPEMTGIELLKIVKERYPHIIRVVMSGQSDTEDIIRAANEGEDYRLLDKSHDLNVFVEIIRRAAEQSKLLGAAQVLSKTLQDREGAGSYQLKTGYTGGMIKVELDGKDHLHAREQVVQILSALVGKALNGPELDIIGRTLVRQPGRMTVFADLGSGFHLAFELPIEQTDG